MENKKTTEIKTPDIQDNQVYWDNLVDKIKKTYQDVGAITTPQGVRIWFSEDWYNTETLQRDYDCYIKDENELIALMNKMVRVPNHKLGRQIITTDELPKRIKESYGEPMQKLIAMGYKKLCLLFGLDLGEDVLLPLVSSELVSEDEYEIVMCEKKSAYQYKDFDEYHYPLTFEYAYYVLETSDTEEGISFKFGAIIDYDWQLNGGSIDIHNPKDVAEIPSAIKCSKWEEKITIEEYILCTIGLLKFGLKNDEIHGKDGNIFDKFHDLEYECMAWADKKAYEYEGQENCDCWVSSVDHK